MNAPMNLRTIQFWAIYNSSTKHIIATDKTKKGLLARWNIRDSPWCVVVKLKGNYVRRSSATAKN